MSLAHPSWLLLLLILPVILLGAILAHRRRGMAWKCLVAPRLRKQLVKEGSSLHRWVSLGLGLAACALLITVIARPHLGKSSSTEQIHTRNLLIAIDTSRSMLVRDGSPDRMTTAKAMALELVEAFPNDRIGIIVFSGTPVLMAPLTIDHGSVHETISQIDTEVIPSGGSDLAAAVQLAIKTFQKPGQKSGALIVISDGEDHSQQVRLAASEILEAGIATCAIGVGSSTGGIIPDPRRNDGKYRDIRGNTVHSRMIPDALKQLASAGHGAYVPASSGADHAIRSALSFLKSDQQEGRKIHIPNERFQWFLLPAIVLLALSLLARSQLFLPKLSATTATTTSVVVGLIWFSLGNHLHGASDIAQANAAYQQKDYKSALDSFHKALIGTQGDDRRAIQFSQGSTAYRLQQWDQATRYFSRALLTGNKKLRQETHYNMGNALFQLGWSQFNPVDKSHKKTDPKTTAKVDNLTTAITTIEDAITHYQATLNLEPEHSNAAFNLDEARKLLDQIKEEKQKAEQKAQDDQQKKDQPKDKDKEKGDDPKDKGDDPQGDKGNPDPNNQDQNNPKNDPQPKDNQPDQKDDPNKDPQADPKENEKPAERREGETEEAFAARILKDHSDAETRPVKRRLIRLRRPAKDW
ncbi:MAG: VWA domain-containing protein [Verrucomicrobiae bacterium]|nr:VWA domain-containing protein [Verrucomicrobiae bacterium]NNJ42153.1 VWA domain-containing protein [Akkermansiaceae bacterium]